VGEQADLLLAGALQESLAHRPLLGVVQVGAGARVLLRTLAELVEKHAVLLAPVLVLQDDVDAPGLRLLVKNKHIVSPVADLDLHGTVLSYRVRMSL
jgi:hypothetical protein